jgi:hypothetical protein
MNLYESLSAPSSARSLLLSLSATSQIVQVAHCQIMSKDVCCLLLSCSHLSPSPASPYSPPLLNSHWIMDLTPRRSVSLSVLSQSPSIDQRQQITEHRTATESPSFLRTPTKVTVHVAHVLSLVYVRADHRHQFGHKDTAARCGLDVFNIRRPETHSASIYF